jgi:hypothetical protein
MRVSFCSTASGSRDPATQPWANPSSLPAEGLGAAVGHSGQIVGQWDWLLPVKVDDRVSRWILPLIAITHDPSRTSRLFSKKLVWSAPSFPARSRRRWG